jgi:hypothetical protein
MDPLEQQEKFDQIQQADNELNALFEAQSVAKKELWSFDWLFRQHICRCIR